MRSIAQPHHGQNAPTMAQEFPDVATHMGQRRTMRVVVYVYPYLIREACDQVRGCCDHYKTPWFMPSFLLNGNKYFFAPTKCSK